MRPDQLITYGQNANGCGTPCTFNIMLGLAYQQQSPISPNIIAAYVPSSPTVAPPAPKYYSSEAVYLGTGMNYMWNGPASPPNPIQPNTGDLSFTCSVRAVPQAANHRRPEVTGPHGSSGKLSKLAAPQAHARLERRALQSAIEGFACLVTQLALKFARCVEQLSEISIGLAQA